MKPTPKIKMRPSIFFSVIKDEYTPKGHRAPKSDQKPNKPIIKTSAQ